MVKKIPTIRKNNRKVIKMMRESHFSISTPAILNLIDYDVNLKEFRVKQKINLVRSLQPYQGC